MLRWKTHTVNNLQGLWQGPRKKGGFGGASNRPVYGQRQPRPNLLAIMSHCGRGDEYLCGQSAQQLPLAKAVGAAVLEASTSAHRE